MTDCLLSPPCAGLPRPATLRPADPQALSGLSGVFGRIGRLLAPLGLACLGLLGGCAWLPQGPATAAPAVASGPVVSLWAINERAELVHVKSDRPDQALAVLPLKGLAMFERVLAMGFRDGDGALVAVSSLGRFCRLDLSSGQATVLNPGRPLRLAGQRFTLHPADEPGQLLLLSDAGQRLRLSSTDGSVQAEPASVRVALAGARGGATELQALSLRQGAMGAAGTAAGSDALDPEAPPAELRMAFQRSAGRAEGYVASLKVGAVDAAHLALRADRREALAALHSDGITRLYTLDLPGRRAQPIGPLADGSRLWNLAVQPQR